MIHSIHAVIVKNGNVARHCAKPGTVVKFLSGVKNLDAYEVRYITERQARIESAKTFLEHYTQKSVSN